MRDYTSVKHTLPTGELYAGLILGKNNCRDHHLVLLPDELEEVPWGLACDWAAQCGGELPTRRELALLYANLREHFQRMWYWSCEMQLPRAHLVWGQNFTSGIQTMYGRPFRGRARAIRRLLID
ncbi:DUF1566 domain-containing protein [Massilia sp. CCM 8695]|uniref:DUF1566 domain-containing protein n=1 Tax=Massilia frigida TaxID=2609281 RepID=A0ABX0NIW2_9BURK|nr:DUF1566 domain-containing protein [Massilia frigida]NHZ82853.1 DUF1566 domain-containing protein [Massilia frigida]